MFVRRINVWVTFVFASLAGCAPVKHVPVVIPTQIIARVAPRYPMGAVVHRREGVAVVLTRVGADGTPVEARIEKSSGYLDLDKAARLSLLSWKFKPETIDDVPVASYVRISVNFNLGSNKASAYPDLSSH